MIVIKRDKNSIKVTGHAGYAARGENIVCSAISTLTQTLVVSVLEMTTDKIEHNLAYSPQGERVIPDSKTAYGNIVIKHGDLSEKSKTLIDSFLIGCLMVANTYPHHVAVEISE